MKKQNKNRQGRRQRGNLEAPRSSRHDDNRLFPLPVSVWVCLGMSLLLVLLIVAAFWPVWQKEFVKFDTNHYVTENPMVRQGLSWEGLRWAFSSVTAANWHPLTMLSHMMDVQLYGLNPAGHQATNLLFHLAAALLLFASLWRMTGRFWSAWCVAAFFAVHPLRVESVVWIAERKDVLGAFFWMLTMWLYVGYAQRGGGWRFLWVLLSLALGLMAKPMLVTLPCVLFLLDYWPLRRVRQSPDHDGGHSSGSWRRCLLEKAVLLIPVIASCVVTFLVQRKEGAMELGKVFSLPSRLGNAVLTYGRYILDTFLPIDLAVFYPQFGIVSWALVAVVLLLLCGLTFLFWWLFKSRPYLLIGWLWYLGVLVPVIGLVQVGWQSHADRYTYLPQVGLLIMLIWLCAEGVARLRIPRAVTAAAVAVLLVGCVVGTIRQSRHWLNTGELFRHAVSVTENNYLAMNSLGAYLLESGRVREAMPWLEESVAISDDYYNGQSNLAVGLAMLSTQQPNRADAMAMKQRALYHFRRAIDIKTTDDRAYFNIAKLYNEMEQYDRAIDSAQKALELNPGNWQAHLALGVAYDNLDQHDAAQQSYARAIELNNNCHEAYYNWGLLLRRLGRYDESIARFRQVVRINPGDADAYVNIGLLYAAKGQPQQAMQAYQRALTVAPKHRRAIHAIQRLQQQYGQP